MDQRKDLTETELNEAAGLTMMERTTTSPPFNLSDLLRLESPSEKASAGVELLLEFNAENTLVFEDDQVSDQLPTINIPWDYIRVYNNNLTYVAARMPKNISETELQEELERRLKFLNSVKSFARREIPLLMAKQAFRNGVILKCRKIVASFDDLRQAWKEWNTTDVKQLESIFHATEGIFMQIGDWDKQLEANFMAEKRYKYSSLPENPKGKKPKSTCICSVLQSIRTEIKRAVGRASATTHKFHFNHSIEKDVKIEDLKRANWRRKRSDSSFLVHYMKHSDPQTLQDWIATYNKNNKGKAYTPRPELSKEGNNTKETTSASVNLKTKVVRTKQSKTFDDKKFQETLEKQKQTDQDNQDREIIEKQKQKRKRKNQNKASEKNTRKKQGKVTNQKKRDENDTDCSLESSNSTVVCGTISEEDCSDDGSIISCEIVNQDNENIYIIEDDWSDNDTDELEKITNHRITKNQKNGQFLEFLTKWDGEDGVTWDCGRTVATDAPILVAKYLIEKKLCSNDDWGKLWKIIRDKKIRKAEKRRNKCREEKSKRQSPEKVVVEKINDEDPFHCDYWNSHKDYLFGYKEETDWKWWTQTNPTLQTNCYICKSPMLSKKCKPSLRNPGW
eukprot:CAMPEP_0178896030 /NCGR_PEP_ID=MMETSP0786-20121207/924_1 /TAXON_ID=186022 /ORGANISM="Thalassionema frauenfeldii, Strain CCMP 1798" /LENGTH=619 /DNA_ID=CAMNT_0020566343 /DNA_START=249 /DNA_END=2105 /DNA_ORIENTATION=+